MKLFEIFLLIFILNHKVAHSAVCDYQNQNETDVHGYTCLFRAVEGEYDGNIISIEGDHDDSHHENPSDEKVLVVQRGFTLGFKVLPSIICEKFINLQAIWLPIADIKEIPENSLINCKKLVYLKLSYNSIKKLHANVFASQSELEILDLRDNEIKKLPANVFAPLKKLRILSLQMNKLKIIDSASFGDHPELKEFNFHYNQLTSFDERIIDNNKALDVIDSSRNPCSDGYFEMEGRDEIKSVLKKCFENYVEFGNQVTSIESDEQITTMKMTTTESEEPVTTMNEDYAYEYDEQTTEKNTENNELTTEENTENNELTTEENNEQTTTETSENNAEDLQMFFQSFATLMNAFGQAFNNETENQERSSDENQVTTVIPDEITENSTATISNENIKSINEKVNVLMEELNMTIAEIQSVKSKNAAIKEENNKLTVDIQNMEQKNQELNTTIKSLMNSNDELRADNEKIHANIQSLINQVNKL